MDDLLTERLLAIPDLDQRPSRFSGRPAFWVGKREIAHFESPGVLDLRLTRKGIRARKEQFAEDSRVTTRGSSDWVEVAYASAEDVEWVVGLVQEVVRLELDR